MQDLNNYSLKYYKHDQVKFLTKNLGKIVKRVVFQKVRERKKTEIQDFFQLYKDLLQYQLTDIFEK